MTADPFSHGDAHRLEQRIFAWGNLQKAEGWRDGLKEAAAKGKSVIRRIRQSGQRAGAMRILRAVEDLLPQNDIVNEAYARGFTDGAAEEGRKARTAPDRNS